MRRAVVPRVRAWGALVTKVVTCGFPRVASIVGALQDLAKPSARLRGVEPLGVGRRPFYVVDLPARKVRALDLPGLPAAVRRDHESALAGPDEKANSAHCITP